MKTIVLKVGSAVLSDGEELAQQRMSSLAKFICELKDRYNVIFVSSGAVAAGYTKLKIDKTKVNNKQALAAIGQPLLMKSYAKKFQEHGVDVAQLLLTEHDLDSRKETSNTKNVLDVLFANSIIPIINENDVTATSELLFGDNDQLSAHICCEFDCDMLVILTDIDGYYDKNPKEHKDAKKYEHIDNIEDNWVKEKPQIVSKFATGGIISKIMAAKKILEHNKVMFLGSGFDLKDARCFLLDDNRCGGTLFSKD
jgi:glutamate 5-kinase